MLLAMLPAPSSEGPSPAGRCGSECAEHVSEAGSAKEPPPSLEPSFDAWLHASVACSPVGQRMNLRDMRLHMTLCEVSHSLSESNLMA